MKAKFVNENLNEFVKDSDPFNTLNIGAFANIDKEIVEFYRILKATGYNINFPDTNDIGLINKNNINMTIVKVEPDIYPGIFDLYVEDNEGNDIPIIELTFEQVLDTIYEIDQNWIEENKDTEDYD